MDTIALIAQLIVAFGIFNVWILRFNKTTAYRPKSASTMEEEFSAYGLGSWSMYIIGGLKLLFAISLVIGIWIPELTRPAAAGIAALMLGAILMHLKVRDPAKKSLPACIMLILSVIVALFAR